jgi:hypothetical protein
MSAWREYDCPRKSKIENEGLTKTTQKDQEQSEQSRLVSASSDGQFLNVFSRAQGQNRLSSVSGLTLGPGHRLALPNKLDHPERLTSPRASQSDGRIRFQRDTLLVSWAASMNPSYIPPSLNHCRSNSQGLVEDVSTNPIVFRFYLPRTSSPSPPQLSLTASQPRHNIPLLPIEAPARTASHGLRPPERRARPRRRHSRAAAPHQDARGGRAGRSAESREVTWNTKQERRRSLKPLGRSGRSPVTMWWT